MYALFSGYFWKYSRIQTQIPAVAFAPYSMHGWANVFLPGYKSL